MEWQREILRRLDGLAAEVRRNRAATQRLEVTMRTCIAGKADCERRCRAVQRAVDGEGDQPGLKGRHHALARQVRVLVGLVVGLLIGLAGIVAEAVLNRRATP